MSTIAIIGAGFSGTMTAVHLLRLAQTTSLTNADIVLIEKTGKFTAGLAYSTPDPRHLLNVPAGRMSAFDDDSNHFLAWCRRRNPRTAGGSFIPRQLYGDYLASVLRDALTDFRASPAAAHTRFQTLAGCVVQLAPSTQGPRWKLSFEFAQPIFADHVVLAMGNFPPASICPQHNDDILGNAGCYAPDPWRLSGPGGVLDVPPNSDVLLVGTGLTMFDLALSFDARRHQGVVYALSRRALLPQAHRDSDAAPPTYSPPAIDTWTPTALGYLRALRGAIDAASDLGVDWREVVTGVRHDTSRLWVNLPDGEKRRFLRHLRPFWETHRHRAAPATAHVIDAMIGSGRLRILAGRIVSIRESDDPARKLAIVSYLPRGQSTRRELSVAKVINCTGPNTNLAQPQPGLIRHLLDQGLIRADPLGLGMDSDDAGGVIGLGGAPTPGLHVVGPMRKGKLWENTAVPELRGEAYRMAVKLSQSADLRVNLRAQGGRIATRG